MKHIKLLSFLFVLSGGLVSHAQKVVAKTDTVNAIIIHQYTKFNDYYCVAPTIMMIGKDKFVFYSDTHHNINLINKYPYIKDQLGNLNNYSYDYLNDALNHIYKHNLSFSEYNYLKNPYIFSTSLYTKDSKTTSYYSIYNFYGVVNFYKGIESKFQQIDKNKSNSDCPCVKNYELKSKSTWFAVLKETFKLTSLSNLQETEFSLYKSELQKLNIMICE